MLLGRQSDGRNRTPARKPQIKKVASQGRSDSAVPPCLSRQRLLLSLGCNGPARAKVLGRNVRPFPPSTFPATFLAPWLAQACSRWPRLSVSGAQVLLRCTVDAHIRLGASIAARQETCQLPHRRCFDSGCRDAANARRQLVLAPFGQHLPLPEWRSLCIYEKGWVVGLMYNSGTCALGGSEATKRTAAATSSGCRI